VAVSSVDPPDRADPNPGIAIKVAVRAATRAEIVLSGLQTIDGVALVDGDRVLVKDQSDATLNGIYAASSGQWRRTIDADGNDDFAQGMLVNVTAGTFNAGIAFRLTSPNPVLLGTSGITWQPLTYLQSAIEFTIDGANAEILPGLRSGIEVPFKCTILSSRVVADRVGSITVDLLRKPFASLPPGPGDTICGGNPPALANALAAQDVTLTGWSLVLNAGDWLFPNVTAALVVREVTVSLLVNRS
jgi:hypothetical protein